MLAAALDDVGDPRRWRRVRTTMCVAQKPSHPIRIVQHIGERQADGHHLRFMGIGCSEVGLVAKVPQHSSTASPWPLSASTQASASSRLGPLRCRSCGSFATTSARQNSRRREPGSSRSGWRLRPLGRSRPPRPRGGRLRATTPWPRTIGSLAHAGQALRSDDSAGAARPESQRKGGDSDTSGRIVERNQEEFAPLDFRNRARWH